MWVKVRMATLATVVPTSLSRRILRGQGPYARAMYRTVRSHLAALNQFKEFHAFCIFYRVVIRIVQPLSFSATTLSKGSPVQIHGHDLRAELL